MIMNTFVNTVHTTTCNCAACAPIPTLGIKMPYEEEKKVTKTRKGRQKLVVGKNDLASQCPKAAEMWSSKNKLAPTEVFAGSGKKAFFVCQNCGREFSTIIQNVVRAINNGGSGCNECARRENGAKKATVAAQKNSLAIAHPKVAVMWSSKNKLSASEIPAGSNKKAFFKCPNCGQEFKAKIQHVVNAVDNGTTGCPVCKGLKVVPGINDLASQCPKAAAMLSSKDKHFAFEVTAGSKKKAIFVCPDCKQKFEAAIYSVTRSVDNGNTGCPVCRGFKVVLGVNDLATKCPKAAALWSSKNKLSASEVAAGSGKQAIFKCPNCGREHKIKIYQAVYSVNNGSTGCYDCSMKRVISKPECFLVRPMLAFSGENGIANPFSDVRNILGKHSRLGLDFVDHIQKLCAEYNGKYFHEQAAKKDRFKFEAAKKAGYTMIRVQEQGLEVLDPKYDIVMPEGFRDSGGRYNAEIMEEVGRKVIHLLEEIYGRKASPEIWALNNFKEFEIWYDANKKELEANARKKGPKGKTAAKMAA